MGDCGPILPTFNSPPPGIPSNLTPCLPPNNFMMITVIRLESIGMPCTHWEIIADKVISMAKAFLDGSALLNPHRGTIDFFLNGFLFDSDEDHDIAFCEVTKAFISLGYSVGANGTPNWNKWLAP
ncbi:hypothetical protein AX17_004821 [Amanita inopinata Kibby_2008]|nr:hypothetical protein AX17_004821 [Amanita inopinata Kibby_2008]